MNWRSTTTKVFCICMMLLLLNASSMMHAQAREALYAKMAPIDQYLMADRNAEIAMARSAAPPSISRNAKVMVLGRHGYETAVEGKNGFVCVVERSWMSPADSPEFWNFKMRGPICFNPPAAQSILPFTYKRTELALAGESKTQILAGIKDAMNEKALPTLAPGAMSYMMSKQSNLGDGVGHWVSHLMFYVPLTAGATWGADLPRSPVMMSRQFAGAPEPITVFMIPVLDWSDGTPVDSAHTHKN